VKNQCEDQLGEKSASQAKPQRGIRFDGKSFKSKNNSINRWLEKDEARLYYLKLRGANYKTLSALFDRDQCKIHSKEQKIIMMLRQTMSEAKGIDSDLWINQNYS